LAALCGEIRLRHDVLLSESTGLLTEKVFKRGDFVAADRDAAAWERRPLDAYRRSWKATASSAASLRNCLPRRIIMQKNQ
jgi:hypothetical protein